MARNYSSTAADTTLSGSITSGATTLSVSATTGFPAAPFVLALDAGAATQELVLVTNVAGTTLTVTRGYDSTVASAHDTGAVVRHSHAAIDFREAAVHIDATAAHGATGAVVGTTNTQTLTSKTLALGNNTVSGTLAQFNTALTDGDFASLAGTETLTNKTLASPTITGVGSTAHARKSSNLSVVSSTTYVADPTLTMAVSTFATYEFHLGWNATYYDGGFNLRLNFPAGGGVVAGGNMPTGSALIIFTQAGGTGPLTRAGDIHGLLVTGGTAGDLFVEFAQNTAHGNGSSLNSDSYMIVRRIA